MADITGDAEINVTVGAGVSWGDVTDKPDNIVSSEYPTGGSVGNVLKKTASGMEWAAGSGTVDSVNGQMGVVVLDNEDVGAAAESHTHAQSDVTGLADALAGKQAAISDLATIRSGAALGATAYQKPETGIPASDMAEAVQTSLGKADTAIQEHQSLSAYRTASAQDVIDSGKQDTISDLATIRSGAASGATAYQKPAAGIPASDMTSAVQTVIGSAITKITAKDGLVSSTSGGQSEIGLSSESQASLAKADTALQSVPNTYRTSAAQDVIDAGKQATISDLATIRSGAAAGATAYQKPATGIPSSDMAAAVQESLGKADTALQEHQSLSAYRTSAAQDTIDSGKQATISDLATIRSGAAAGATAYQKPAAGIPASDMTSAVQTVIGNAITKITAKDGLVSSTSGGQSEIGLSSESQASLAKADTALQSVPNTYRTSAAQDVIDNAIKGNADNQKRRIDALYAANEGKSYNYETSSAAAYQKTVPSGSVGGTVDSFGGKSVVWNQCYWDSSVEEASAYGLTSTILGNNKFRLAGTVTVTAAARALQNSQHITSSECVAYVIIKGNNSDIKFRPDGEDTADGKSSFVVIIGANKSLNPVFNLDNLSVGDVVDETIEYAVCDMTKMFGVTTTAAVTDEMKAFCEAYAAAHPGYNAGEIVSADVTAIISKDADAETLNTLAIPAAVRALPGYGWSAGTVANTVDWANRKYIQRVARVDLGTFTTASVYQYGSSTHGFGFNITSLKCSSSLNSLCANYPKISYANVDTLNGHYINTTTQMIISDLSADSTTYDGRVALLKSLSGVMLYYELATPIETDISSLISNDNFFSTETGGTLTFTQSGTQLPVPNTETLVVKISGVTA